MEHWKQKVRGTVGIYMDSLKWIGQRIPSQDSFFECTETRPFSAGEEKLRDSLHHSRQAVKISPSLQIPMCRQEEQLKASDKPIMSIS